jgi:MarR family transcriptional regulator for hemolysin
MGSRFGKVMRAPGRALGESQGKAAKLDRRSGLNDEHASGSAEIACRLFRLTAICRTLLDRDLAPFDLTLATALPLAYLERLPFGATQGELAAEMDITNSALVRIFDELEKARLIERRVDTADRRIKRIYLTDAGHRNYTVFKKIEAQLEKKLFSALPDRALVLNALEEALRAAAFLRAPETSHPLRKTSRA